MLRTFTCQKCNRPFETKWFPSRDIPKFCSPECRKKRKTIECKVCHKTFDVYASRDRIYCSAECMNIGIRRKADKLCVFCGKYHNKPNKRKYCSYECSVKHRQSLVNRSCCKYCGNPIDPRRSMKHRKYCSQECSGAAFAASGIFSGSKHPNWRGGHTNTRGANWKAQSNLARQRDSNSCQICGKQSIKPRHPVHHIKPFKEFGIENYEVANELSNLITLCKSCHQKVERGTLSLKAS